MFAHHLLTDRYSSYRPLLGSRSLDTIIRLMPVYDIVVYD